MSLKEEYQRMTKVYIFISIVTKTIFFILISVSSVLIAKYNANIINNISKGVDFKTILILSIPFGLITLLNIVLNYILFVVDLYIPKKFCAKCRMLAYDKLINSNPIELNKYNNSMLFNILGSNVNDVMNRKYFLISTILGSLITIVIYTINFNSFFPYYLSPIIFMIYFIVVFISKKQAGKITLFVSENIKKQNEFSLLLNELYDNFEEIKLLGIEDEIEKKISIYMHNQRELQRNKQKYEILVGTLKALPNVTISILIFLYIYWNIMNRHYDIGSFYLGLSIAAAYISSFSSIFELYSQILSIKPAEKPLISFFDLKDDMELQKSDTNLSEKKLTHLSCDNLSFSYEESNVSEGLINEFNICLKDGWKLILKGPSGCGKTTLLKLLSGLYVPDRGTISYYDNKKKYSPMDCRYLFGYHLQNPIMFRDTIRNNITLGKEYSDQVIFDVLKKVRLYDVVMNKSDRLDEKLGYSGVGLSGGERQRLALGRILLKNPSVVFLDESFSALDDKTSQEIYNNIDVPISIISLHRDNFIDDDLRDKTIIFKF